MDMTHDFIHTSLYCRFSRPLSENVIKKGGHRCRFQDI